MPSLEEMYRATLLELAEDGNEKARLMISLSNQLGNHKSISQIKAEVVNELRNANDDLRDALDYNDDEWTGNTDTSIQNAQSHILNAVALLTR
jgi:hypothetical protein